MHQPGPQRGTLSLLDQLAAAPVSLRFFVQISGPGALWCLDPREGNDFPIFLFLSTHSLATCQNSTCLSCLWGSLSALLGAVSIWCFFTVSCWAIGHLPGEDQVEGCRRPRGGGNVLQSNLLCLSYFYSLILPWIRVDFYFFLIYFLCGVTEQDIIYFPYHVISGSFY